MSFSTRRQFFGLVGAVCAAVAAPIKSLHAAMTTKPPAVVKDRAPLYASTYYRLPVGSITPRGWLRQQLQIQAAGMTGHLDEFWKDVGPNSGWLGGTGESWERGPYYLDGLLPLAYLLDDAKLKAKAQRYIDWTLNNAQPDGMIGPRSNNDWWPRMVMLKALTQYAEATGDTRVVPVMQKYFARQLADLPNRPLRDWGRFRWQDEVLSVIWLYNRTGDNSLLELAKLLHKQGHDWQAQYADFQFTEPVTSDYLRAHTGHALENGHGLEDPALSAHGVNNGQAVKTAAVWSLISGSQTDRNAVLQMIGALDKYHGLPNGMFSCDEHLAGRDPSHGSELCTVVEYMFSLETALGILGNAALGDKLERVAFNALPGTLTDDMWAHQYDQEPNQVECSLHSKPWVSNGAEANIFGLEPNYGCCTANYHQGWPKFAGSLFMLSGEQNSDSDDGLVAAAYAPCEVRIALRGGTVHLISETEYPFRGEVRMTFREVPGASFPLSLRIPSWADGTSIRVNGVKQDAVNAGSFAKLERKWRVGDVVEIAFPMRPRTSRWFNNSVAVERGPLVFSYGIGEDWVKLRDRGMTADWQIFPTTAWNYALLPDDDIRVTETAAAGAMPFSAKETAVKLHAKARRLTPWRAVDGVAAPLPQSPVETTEPVEEITLIPYAAAKLRITAFPQSRT